MYISAEGAQAQTRRLEVVANNLANVDTVGFKRELAVFQARYAEAIQRGQATAGSGSINDIGGGIKVSASETDFSPGPMKLTKTPTDMAIDGDGFFVVDKGGEHFLTRAGNFRLTDRGQLVTQQGYPVLSESFSPITVDPAGGDWQLDGSGTLRQQGNAQNLAVVQPQSPGDLSKASENLFRPLADPHPVPAAERHVLSGYLEQSGVKPTSEMMEMIEASRAVEANVNMMQTQDQMLSDLNKLLQA
jgi:flagellar basal-body rod protein FlgF